MSIIHKLEEIYRSDKNNMEVELDEYNDILIHMTKGLVINTNIETLRDRIMLTYKDKVIIRLKPGSFKTSLIHN